MEKIFLIIFIDKILKLDLSALCWQLDYWLLVIGCDNSTTSKKPGPKTVNVKYQITGSAATASSISYKNSTGGDDRLNNVTLPWEKSISVTIEGGSGYYATLSGSNTGGNLTAKIFADGKEIKSVSSSGDGFFTVVAVEIIKNY